MSAGRAAVTSRIPLVIDTDIGSFADDYVAIALALQSPEVDLLGITTVHADARLRARLALHFLGLAGRTGLAVHPGASRALLDQVEQRLFGFEKDILRDVPRQTISRQPAAAFLVELARRTPGLIVLAIGPLTNIALAQALDPAFPGQAGRLVIMGGSLRNGPDWLDIPLAEWNFAADPEAARAVLESNVPITLVPYDVGNRVRLDSVQAEQIGDGGSDIHRHLVGRMILGMCQWSSDYSYPFDALALATILEPGLVTRHKVAARVLAGAGDLSGLLAVERPSRDRRANVDLVTDVDVDRSVAFLLGRLSAPLRRPG